MSLLGLGKARSKSDWSFVLSKKASPKMLALCTVQKVPNCIQEGIRDSKKWRKEHKLILLSELLYMQKKDFPTVVHCNS